MKRILTNYNQQSCCFGFKACLLNFFGIFPGLTRKGYLIHPATHKTRGHIFQEGFLCRPLSNLPCPGLNLSILCHSSLKYCGISETAGNHARQKVFHPATGLFRFLRSPVLSCSKHNTENSVRQGGQRAGNAVNLKGLSFMEFNH